MIEPEMAFADLDDNMILAESMLKYVIRYVLENAPEEMQSTAQGLGDAVYSSMAGMVSSRVKTSVEGRTTAALVRGMPLSRAAWRRKSAMASMDKILPSATTTW